MEINLIWEELGKDGDGFPQTTVHQIEVPAKEKSVTRAEHYAAMSAKVSVKTIFEIRVEDWEETRHIVNNKPEYARKVEIDDAEYDIIRTYKTGKAKIEVVCG